MNQNEDFSANNAPESIGDGGDKQPQQSRLQRIVGAALLVVVLSVLCFGILFTVRYPNRYGAIIERVAKTYGLDADLLRGVVWTESKFRADAKSNRGASGLMQLMPATAAECAQNIGLNPERMDLLDPETNLTLGAYYLHYLLEKFSPDAALAAYNAGEGKVATWLSAGLTLEKFPYKETRDYVVRVYRAQKIYRFRQV